ncbi:MAG: pilus assembly protein [Pyrinomonadaceae bacterium]|nr:pilus assembly protein [Pyrinomonadaceae bacterium]
MNALNMLAHLKNRLRAILGREDGGSIIELAIVFPILLILFVGTAELGRLFYTYTTLAKATKVGARYLSTSRNSVNGTATQITDAKNEARNLVVCGIKNSCTNQPPIVPGLTTANVKICDNFSVPCVPALAGGPIKYFKVEITNYTYAPGAWNLATMTGLATSTFYFPLVPGTEIRYMP